MTVAIDITVMYVARTWENESAMSFGRSALSREDSFSLADGNFELEKDIADSFSYALAT